MALKFIDIDPRIPFGLITTFNLQMLADKAVRAARRSFTVRIVEPQSITAKRNAKNGPDENEVAITFETGFILVPLTRVLPQGLIAKGWRVESANLFEAHAVAQAMFEWSIGSEPKVRTQRVDPDQGTDRQHL